MATIESALAGRVVAITGGARGIGRAIAEAAARRGARVAVGDLDARLAAEVPGVVGGFELDVTDVDSFGRFLDQVEDQLGPVDVLVNNAGIMFVGAFLEQDLGALRKQTDVNLHGTMIGTRLALERMGPRDRGHIVNITSAGSYMPTPGEAMYSATKHAARAFTESVRDELRGTGIELTAVMPGLVRTDLAAGTRAGRGTQWIEPEDVADAVVAAMERPRPDVFVPRSLGPLLRLHNFLPFRGRRALARLFQVDKIALGADPAERAAYLARIGGAPEGDDG
jgi:NAD(P)-dependent dehydrogenase (short-subunit alcohol dehydrogenase family)